MAGTKVIKLEAITAIQQDLEDASEAAAEAAVAAHASDYEPALGNPSVNGYVLSSTTSGTRSWIAQSGGSGGGVELGETETTAYRGDRGKTAYDTSQTVYGWGNHASEGYLKSVTHHASTHATGQADALTAANIGAEPALGNPGTSGYVLSSTDAGVRSWVAQSVESVALTSLLIDGGTDIGEDLADGDELPVYNASATANRKSALSRVWTYIAAKLAAYTGAITASSISLNQNISQAAWTTNGVRVKNTAVTLTDTTSSGTVAAAYTNRWGGNTIAASNTTTFTDYATHYFDAPVAGTNVTITKAWAAIFNGAVKALFRNITEDIYYAEVTANVTIDFANGDVQFLYVNPSGSSIQITLPSDPGALSKSGILFVKNNTGKAHTWNTSPAIRFVDQADADTVPTPAAVGYYTRYTCQWHDNNGGTGSWWVTVAGRDTA
jgi:hypothetical protein